LTDNNSNIKIRKIRQQLQWQLQEIQKGISTGYDDGEIMKDLGIKPSLFYYYKSKINKASADIQPKKSEHTLAFEQQILKDRLVRFFTFSTYIWQHFLCVTGHSIFEVNPLQINLYQISDEIQHQF
jgi:hypothetical protein